MNQSLTKIGIGPTAQDPLYGLLNTEKNFFYAVDYRKHIVDELFEFFKDYKTTVVIPISACGDWFYNKIDNSVCYNWGVSVYDPEFRAKNLEQNCVFLTNRKDKLTSELTTLITNLQEVCKQFAGIDNCLNRSPHPITINLVQLFGDDPWIQHAFKIEQSRHDNKQSQLIDIANDAKKILKSYSVFDKNYCTNIQQKMRYLETKYKNICIKGQDL
jgi:hypothetical protein